MTKIEFMGIENGEVQQITYEEGDYRTAIKLTVFDLDGTPYVKVGGKVYYLNMDFIRAARMARIYPYKRINPYKPFVV